MAEVATQQAHQGVGRCLITRKRRVVTHQPTCSSIEHGSDTLIIAGFKLAAQSADALTRDIPVPHRTLVTNVTRTFNTKLGGDGGDHPLKVTSQQCWWPRARRIGNVAVAFHQALRHRWFSCRPHPCQSINMVSGAAAIGEQSSNGAKRSKAVGSTLATAALRRRQACVGVQSLGADTGIVAYG